MGQKIDESVLYELLKGCERPEDLLGDGGLPKNLKTALMQRMLGAELTERLGYDHGQEPPIVQTNRRNGASRKTVKSEDGALQIEVLARPVARQANGTFAERGRAASSRA